MRIYIPQRETPSLLTTINMKRTNLIIYILCISLFGVLLFSTQSFGANDEQATPVAIKVKMPWTGKLKDGTVINEKDLAKILQDHKKWLETRVDKERNTILSEANLIGANLSEANLSWTDLSKANLSHANMRHTDLSHAKLNGTKLIDADLATSYLAYAVLKNTDLKDSIISSVNFKDSLFEPLNISEGLEFHEASGFSSIKFKKITPVVKLRKLAKDAGLRPQERRLTAALRKNRKKKRILETFFLDLPTDYGSDPGRSIIILGSLFIICSMSYIIALILQRKNKDHLQLTNQDGIWMEWTPNRMRKNLGDNEPQLLVPSRWYNVVAYGFYFGLLSAFHIGWRDLNVGSWISRIQPREYTLKATGWVRVVSGLHSLISIYLLSLWVLTQFGRPFE